MRILSAITGFAALFAVTALSSCNGGGKTADNNEVSPELAVMQRYMDTYPQSQLRDMYKFFFQDFFGAEHLITDSAASLGYIEYELSNADSSDWNLPRFYYPLGTDSNYWRVDVGYVRDGVLTAGQLTSALLRSANPSDSAEKPSIETWRRHWESILALLPQIDPQPQCIETDSAIIDSLLVSGHYAMHHSKLFNGTYHQHYRIIRRDIFEAEILPLLK